MQGLRWFWFHFFSVKVILIILSIFTLMSLNENTSLDLVGSLGPGEVGLCASGSSFTAQAGLVCQG